MPMTNPITLLRVALLCTVTALCTSAFAQDNSPAPADVPTDTPTTDTPDTSTTTDPPLPDAPSVLTPPTPSDTPPEAATPNSPLGERMAYGGFQATPLAPPIPFSDMEIAGLSLLLTGSLATVTGAILWAQGFETAGPVTTGLGAATSATGATLFFIDRLDSRPAPLDQPVTPDTTTQSTFWLGFSGSF